MSTTTVTGQTLLEEGRLAAAREQFWEEVAAAPARDVEALATAALGLGGMWVHEHRSTLERARVVAVQRRALERLDPSTPLAHRLRMRLTAEAAYVSGELAAVFEELDRARRTADPVVLAEALSLAHHCLLGPHHGAARLALAEELIAVSASTGRPVDGLMGLTWRTVDLFLLGDRRASRSLRELRELLAVERCDGLSYVVAALDVTVAMRAGRLDEAEVLAGVCHRLGEEVGDADALGWYGAQLLAIRWLQGRGAELLPLMSDLAQSTTMAEPNDGFVAAVAALAASAGDDGTARAALASLRARGLGSIQSSSGWLATVVGVAECAHTLGDVDCAREAYGLLLPFADLPVMASLAVACFGSTHRALGLAAWTSGQLDLAVEHLDAAAAADLAFGNGPCHVIDRMTLADALEERGRPTDAERAVALRREAVADAERFAMTARVQEWAQRRSLAGAVGAVSCRRDGRVWTVTVGERTALVPHCVGLGYLGQLIEHPGGSIAAVELASGYALGCRGGPTEPVIDDRARADYRRRIEELRSDVDDAEACADLERAARAHAELDCFVETLARSTGFAGRPRRFDDDAERARVSVHKAIKRSIAAITEVDPVVGRAIAGRVVTGLLCSFSTAPTV